MSNKNDVLTHLMEHEGEVVSLPALASQLDLTLEQVRTAITLLRNGSTPNMVGLKEQLRVVSKGYAVKYVNSPSSKPAPELAKASVTEGTNVADMSRSPIDIELDRLKVVGAITRQVLRFLMEHPNQTISSGTIITSTGLTQDQVYGALYNTMSNVAQRNPLVMNYFKKISSGQYRYMPPGVNSTNGAIPKSDPVTEKIVKQKYESTPKSSTTVTTKRIFEEVRTLPDGTILIEDENGYVYKAREV